MIDSRAKGARVEREIALSLESLTGIRFARNLEQSRSAAQGDLIPDDPAWPFSIEIKARQVLTDCETAWKLQAATAAIACGKMPCVVMKFNGRAPRVALPMSAIAQAFGGTDTSDEWATISLPGLAMIAAEIMAAERECNT